MSSNKYEWNTEQSSDVDNVSMENKVKVIEETAKMICSTPTLVIKMISSFVDKCPSDQCVSGGIHVYAYGISKACTYSQGWNKTNSQ